MLRFFIPLFFVGLAFSANTQQYSQTVTYLFAGHTMQLNDVGDKIDYRLEGLDKSVYDGIWLGGDVCIEPLLNYSTVQYIDSVIDLGNPETHWAMGNHDAREGNWEWYEEFTGRPTYYAYTSNNITRIILNTNLVPTNCEMIDDQYKLITNVCDTINKSYYLILLMHHGLWRDIPGLPQPVTYANSDLVYWSANCDSVNTPFSKFIYPKLLDVQKRGIKVICLMGDLSGNKKTFNRISDDGIQF
ncbi:MAG: metallophosphoesterase, partial [Chlorobi bacterium]|nr:metallophosphoesterase [Chlorobiota bacterium]